MLREIGQNKLTSLDNLERLVAAQVVVVAPDTVRSVAPDFEARAADGDPVWVVPHVKRVVARPFSAELGHVLVEEFSEIGERQSVRVDAIDPVSMFVPEGIRAARVQLSEGDIARARSVGIEKTPYVVLADGLTKQSTSLVKVIIPSEQSRLTTYSISPATLSIALSPAMFERYSPEVTNLPDVLGRVAIRATAEAKRTYENQTLPHMTLYIYDDDKEQGSREVVYNFPAEFVRKGQIELAESPAQPALAKFKLIPLTEGETAATRAK